MANHQTFWCLLNVLVKAQRTTDDGGRDRSMLDLWMPYCDAGSDGTDGRRGREGRQQARQLKHLHTCSVSADPWWVGTYGVQRGGNGDNPTNRPPSARYP